MSTTRQPSPKRSRLPAPTAKQPHGISTPATPVILRQQLAACQARNLHLKRMLSETTKTYVARILTLQEENAELSKRLLLLEPGSETEVHSNLGTARGAGESIVSLESPAESFPQATNLGLDAAKLQVKLARVTEKEVAARVLELREQMIRILYT